MAAFLNMTKFYYRSYSWIGFPLFLAFNLPRTTETNIGGCISSRIAKNSKRSFQSNGLGVQSRLNIDRIVLYIPCHSFLLISDDSQHKNVKLSNRDVHHFSPSSIFTTFNSQCQSMDSFEIKPCQRRYMGHGEESERKLNI